MEDLENLSRRNKLRLVGLPKTIPAQELQVICEVDLPAALQMERRCRVERAHCIGPDPSHCSSPDTSTSQPPRQVIVKYLNYNDKADILCTFYYCMTIKLLLYSSWDPMQSCLRRRPSRKLSVSEAGLLGTWCGPNPPPQDRFNLGLPFFCGLVSFILILLSGHILT